MTRNLTRETSVALAAAREAGAMALSLQGVVSTRLKDDGSPVSDADLAADAILRAHLTSQFPEDAILSEEVLDDPRRLQASRLWIIDPIDGTSDYLGGRPDWAVQIALAIDGVLVLGVVAVPGEDVVLVGVPGAGGSILTGTTAQELSVRHVARDTLITSSSARNRESLAAVRTALPEFSALYATSVGIKVWRMLQGQADLYVHPRKIAEWDVAAPAAVLCAAGGHASDLAGHRFHFNAPSARCDGLVFSVRDDHQRLIDRLQSGGVGLR